MRYSLLHIKSLLFLCCFWTAQFLAAQKIAVESFTYEEMDVTAITQPVVDKNKNKCALIKVYTTLKGLSFDVGSLGVEETRHKVGEIWLYVPYGVRKISITHSQMEPLLNYDLGMSVKSGRTYALKLSTGQTLSGVLDYEKQQKVEIVTFPKHAEVGINGNLELTDEDGKVVKNLAHGTYSLRVAAENYHPYEKLITVDEQTKTLSIVLKQAFGYLSVPSSPINEGAELFVDGNHVGVVPLERYPLKSGEHLVKVAKPFYKSYEDKISIADSVDFLFEPILDANYAMTNFQVSDEAEIWLDEQLLGKGQWTGKVERGRHTVVCKLPSHQPSVRTIEVVDNAPLTISCDAPQPMYGSLDIHTIPEGCDIEIDGKYVGQSPYLAQHVLVGDKKVKISKEGYLSETREVKVEQHQQLPLDFHLTNICTIRFVSTPNHSTVYVDDKNVGQTPVQVQYPSGKYAVTVKYDGYKDYRKEMSFGAGDAVKQIQLSRLLLFDNEFYVDLGYRLLSASGLSVHLGGYYHGFNAELGYVKGMGDVETFYWNSDHSSSSPIEATYQQSTITGRLGYGFVFGSRFRLTPQLGINHVMLGEQTTGDTAVADGAYALAGVLALRFNFSINRHLGLVVSPEYGLSIKKSTSFDLMSALSSKVKKQVSGFALGAGVLVYF